MPKNKAYDPDEEVEEKVSKQHEHDAAKEEAFLQKIAEAEQKTAEYWERIVRMQAEADNAARRVERDISNAHKYAIEKFVGELLPIVDSLELCVINETSDHKVVSSVVEGVNMTLKMFYTAMEKFGIQQINPVGEAYDPEYQQAISVEVDPELEPNTVTKVLQKGYTLNNRLVRPALVVVSKTEN